MQPPLQPPPAHGYPPVPPPKRKVPIKWLLLGAAGFLVLCCGGVTAIGLVFGEQPADNEAAPPPASVASAPTTAAPTAPATKAPPPPPPKPAGPGLGDPVRDGKFEFVVHSVKCGATKVGSEYFTERAQGVFCRLAVTVKNIGDEVQTFSGSSQKAFDAKGTEFSNDGEAELYANEGNATFLEEINPGNSVKGTLIFDVPKGTKLVAAELHDSPFSGGVRVRLS